MRILHVSRQFWPCIGGVENFVLGLAVRQARQGHSVGVIALDHCFGSGRRLSARDEISGVPVTRLAYYGSQHMFWAPEILRLAQGYDLIHIHNTDFFLDFLTRARTWGALRARLVVSPHGGFFHTSAYAALKRLWFATITPGSFSKVDLFIPNSHADERRFASLARRTRYVNYAIDVGSLAQLERCPVPERLVTVSRIAPNKRIDRLLAAFELVQREIPMATLVIAGGAQGLLVDSLASQASHIPNVTWLGEIADEVKRNELMKASVFVSASSYEAFGLAVLEAMAAGIVPVVNAIESFRDLIEQGRDGYLTDFALPQTAATALIEALRLPGETAAQIRAAARAKATEYDWEPTLAKMEAAYAEAAAHV